MNNKQQSCIICKHCKKKTNRLKKYYYMCNKTQTQIEHSVFQPNSCFHFISKIK